MTLYKDTVSVAANTYTTTINSSSFDTPTFERIERLHYKIETLEKQLEDKEKQVTMLLEILNAHLGKQV